MAEQQRQSLCPRLIDYLAIVGSRSSNMKHPGNGQNPPVQVSQSKINVFFKFVLFLKPLRKLVIMCTRLPKHMIDVIYFIIIEMNHVRKQICCG